MTQTSGRKFMVGGNWKCNGNTKSVTDLCKGLSNVNTNKVDVIISPVSIHISLAQSLLKDTQIHIASQNVSSTGTGAYTGEIAPEQLKDININWTLVGHSERRGLYGCTDDLVTKKITNGLTNGLNIIACLGETQTERDNNKVEEVIKRQMKSIISGVNDEKYWANMVIAYEPVWAIGTGNVCKPNDAQDACKLIRDIISKSVSSTIANKVRILYGGSVKPNNAKELISQNDIDGFLVGGASLEAKSFGGIISHVQQCSKL